MNKRNEIPVRNYKTTVEDSLGGKHQKAIKTFNKSSPIQSYFGGYLPRFVHS